MASSDSGSGMAGKDNRNLWIILGSVLGALVVGFVVGILWTCRRRLQGKKLLPMRTVTPLDDAEFESWRRPSTYTQRPGRYTVMSKHVSLTPPLESEDYQHYTFEKYMSLTQRPKTPPPRPATPPRSRRTTLDRRRSRTSSIQDRPPTPYSSRRRSEEDALSSPSSVTKPTRTHRRYPSTSDASDLDYEFEKFNFDFGQLIDHSNGARRTQRQ
jgi:hypothetical protein